MDRTWVGVTDMGATTGGGIGVTEVEGAMVGVIIEVGGLDVGATGVGGITGAVTAEVNELGRRGVSIEETGQMVV